MAKRSYRPERIIKKLREAEVLLSQGSTVGEAEIESCEITRITPSYDAKVKIAGHVNIHR